MTQKQIFGLVGAKGSGKSTLANLLVRDHNFRRISFTQGLKAMLRTFLAGQGLSMDTIVRMLEGDLKETPTPYLDNKTPRHAMQTLGTEWGRECISGKIWVNAWHRSAATANQSIVADDVRFLNEAEAIRNMGGLIILVSRQGLSLSDDHISEQELKQIVPDRIIVNGEGDPEKMLYNLKAIGVIQ